MPPARESRPQVIEVGVDNRYDEEREQCRGNQASDHSARHGRPEFGARANFEHQRQHAENHSQSRHKDRAEPDFCRSDQRISSSRTCPPLDIGEINQQDSILGYQSISRITPIRDIMLRVSLTR